MTRSNSSSSNRLSRRSVLKVAGISLTGLIGSSGVGAASSRRRRTRTTQRQEAQNVNVQLGSAQASGEGSSASVSQQSNQTISQNQQAGRRRNGDPDNGDEEPIENGPAPLDPDNGDNGPPGAGPPQPGT